MNVVSNPFRAAMAAIAALSALALLAASGWQAIGDAQPCPWCTLQRLVFWATLVVSAVAFVATGARRRNEPSRGAALRVGIAGSIAAIALTGIAAAGYQSFLLVDTGSCALTFADRVMDATGLPQAWPFMFAATGPCGDANVPVAGIPMSVWSLALFVAVFAAAVAAAAAALRGREPAPGPQRVAQAR
ncbi:MAG TPA: disulfide bond formation protein B [Burkholderiaceae bacterium]|nr:disulfide bond formation protein B [Burkholderiaceae bacterium]